MPEMEMTTGTMSSFILFAFSFLICSLNSEQVSAQESGGNPNKSLAHTIFDLNTNEIAGGTENTKIIFRRKLGEAGLDCPLAISLNGIFEGELNEDDASFAVQKPPAKYQIAAIYRCSGLTNIFRDLKDYNMRSRSLEVQPGTEITYTLTTLCVRNNSNCSNTNPVVIASVEVLGEPKARIVNLSLNGNANHPVDVRYEYRLNGDIYSSPKYRLRSQNHILQLKREGTYKFYASLAGKTLPEIELEEAPGRDLAFAFKVPTIELPQRIASNLGQRELEAIESKNILVKIPDESYGVVIDVQGQDMSTPGSTMGSFLGAEYARRQFNDRFFQDQHNRIQQGQSVTPYSSTGSMKAQILGAIIGSGMDVAPTQMYKFRYSIRTGDSRIVSRDILSNEPFRLSRGTCINVATLQPFQQQVCEWDVEQYRTPLFGRRNAERSVSSIASGNALGLQDRLKQLKQLYDQNLITKDQYDAQVKFILNQ
jgi:hypothetical protein